MVAAASGVADEAVTASVAAPGAVAVIWDLAVAVAVVAVVPGAKEEAVAVAAAVAVAPVVVVAAAPRQAVKVIYRVGLGRVQACGRAAPRGRRERP